MRRSARLLSLVGVVFAIAIAALLLLPLGKQAARDADLIPNDLCIVAPANPYDCASGLAMLAPRPIPADLFVFLQKGYRHDRRYDLDDVAASFVSDFETGKWIVAQDAFFVHGSNVFGPMRDADLPAFVSREAADSLARSRGGRVLLFTNVTPELIQSLNRSVHHRH